MKSSIKPFPNVEDMIFPLIDFYRSISHLDKLVNKKEVVKNNSKIYPLFLGSSLGFKSTTSVKNKENVKNSNLVHLPISYEAVEEPKEKTNTTIKIEESKNCQVSNKNVENSHFSHHQDFFDVKEGTFDITSENINKMDKQSSSLNENKVNPDKESILNVDSSSSHSSHSSFELSQQRVNKKRNVYYGNTSNINHKNNKNSEEINLHLRPSSLTSNHISDSEQPKCKINLDNEPIDQSNSINTKTTSFTAPTTISIEPALDTSNLNLNISFEDFQKLFTNLAHVLVELPSNFTKILDLYGSNLVYIPDSSAWELFVSHLNMNSSKEYTIFDEWIKSDGVVYRYYSINKDSNHENNLNDQNNKFSIFAVQIIATDNSNRQFINTSYIHPEITSYFDTQNRSSLNMTTTAPLKNSPKLLPHNTHETKNVFSPELIKTPFSNSSCTKNSSNLSESSHQKAAASLTNEDSDDDFLDLNVKSSRRKLYGPPTLSTPSRSQPLKITNSASSSEKKKNSGNIIISSTNSNSIHSSKKDSTNGPRQGKISPAGQVDLVFTTRKLPKLN